MAKKKGEKTPIIYQTKSGALELRGDLENETVWATLDQIAAMFDRDKSVISRHLGNIFREGELTKNSVVAKNATTASDGKTYQVEYYNLEAIISVGYRVNSKIATKFRQWATKILRDHITKGYTINQKRVSQNYDAFIQAVNGVQNLLPEQATLDSHTILELIKEFASTWVSLDAYDKGALTLNGATKKQVTLVGADLHTAIAELKNELKRKGEATDFFATERENGSIEGIVGNVLQSFGGKQMYPTVEEKAAHLLYFIVKNHPFTDGNKRSGAFAFMWLLRKAGVRGGKNINPAALTVLTLLIAESNSSKKDQVVALVTHLLR